MAGAEEGPVASGSPYDLEHDRRAPGKGTGMLRRFLKEPLLHFLLIGLAIFAWYGVVNNDAGPQTSAPQIVIRQADTDRLAQQFEGVWRRSPTPEEAEGMLQEYLREEIYYRQALELGLDQGDAVIRQRLRQKMEFLADAGGESLQPGPGELEAFFAEKLNQFTPKPRLSFAQVFMGDNPGGDAIEAALAALRGGGDPGLVGGPTLLPPEMRDSPASIVDGTFGAGFFEKLKEVVPGEWAGPVQSGYGSHLVRVAAVSEPPVPELDDVREAVLAEWQRGEAMRLAEERYNRLLAGYDVVLPGEGGAEE